MPMQAIVGMLHEVHLTGRQTLVYHVAHHRMAHLQTFTANRSGCIWDLCESRSKCTVSECCMSRFERASHTHYPP